MEKFIGVKHVDAKPMTRKEYNDFRGWELPDDENGDDPGFLKDDRNGHVQWDPEDVFKRDFRPVDAMTFGMAIEAMNNGHKVARAGWNGKGMFVYLVAGSHLHMSELRNEAAKHALKAIETSHVWISPHIDMKAADGSLVIGWLASQTDMLSDDWMIVE